MLVKQLKFRKKQLEKYLGICESFLEKAPRGKLLVSSSRGYRTFYHREESGSKRTLLLMKENSALIKTLAKKEYYGKLIIGIKRELSLIKKLLELEENQTIQRMDLEINENKRDLISPLEESLESRLARWENLESPHLEIEGDKNKDNPHVTLNGEHVRSAAERTIANALKKANIPYKYEYPFHTADDRTLYPDFTIMNPNTGEVFRWEHLGMMERPKYVRDQLDKLDSYYCSGLFTGNGLILTFGDSYQWIRQEMVDSIIETLLK